MLLAGREVDPRELERVQVDAQDLALRLRIQGVQVQLRSIYQHADAAGEGVAAKVAKLGSSRFRKLADAAREIEYAVGATMMILVEGSRHAGTPDAASAKKTAVIAAQQRFEQIRSDRELETFISDAIGVIEAQQLRTTLIQTAAMIGLAIASAGVGSLAGRAAAGRLMTAEGVTQIEMLSSGARFALGGTQLAASTAANAVGDEMLTGKSFGWALVDNAIFALGGLAGADAATEMAAARGFDKYLAKEVAAIERVEASAANRVAMAAGKAMVWGARQTIGITAEAIMGMALGGLASALRGEHATGITPEDLALQGASAAVGKLVHAAMSERLPALRGAHGEAGESVRTRGHELLQTAAELTKSKRTDLALRVLEEYAGYLHEEMRLMDLELLNAPRDPSLASQRHELEQQIGRLATREMLEVRLHLVGLRKLGPDLWQGSATEVERAVREAQREGAKAPTVEDGATVIELHDRKIRLHGDGREKTTEPESRPPDVSHELASGVAMVPGSSLRKSTQLDGRLAEKARAAMPGLAGIASIESVRAHDAKTFVVTTKRRMVTTIEVVVARLDGSDVARVVPNSARKISIAGVAIDGEHLIQLSPNLAEGQVERTLAHSVERLLVVHEAAMAAHYPHERTALGGDERGRVAELELLARQIERDPARAEPLRGEVLALVEYLGLASESEGARAKLAAVEHELAGDRAALDELHRARATTGRPLEVMRTAAHRDLEIEQAAHARRRISRDAPIEMAERPGQRIDRAQLQEYASIAERMRRLISERTLAKYREQARGCIPEGRQRAAGWRGGAGGALGRRGARRPARQVAGRW